LEHLPWDGDLRHLEGNIASVADHLRTDLDQLLLQARLSCNQAAKQFGVAVSTAIGWVRRLRETGSVAPGKMGGHRPKAISGEHRVWVLQRIKRDFTLRGLVAELAVEGRLPSGSSSTPRSSASKKAWWLANAIVPSDACHLEHLVGQNHLRNDFQD
jgi:transposase